MVEIKQRLMSLRRALTHRFSANPMHQLARQEIEPDTIEGSRTAVARALRDLVESKKQDPRLRFKPMTLDEFMAGYLDAAANFHYQGLPTDEALQLADIRFADTASPAINQRADRLYREADGQLLPYDAIAQATRELMPGFDSEDRFNR